MHNKVFVSTEECTATCITDYQTSSVKNMEIPKVNIYYNTSDNRVNNLEQKFLTRHDTDHKYVLRTFHDTEYLYIFFIFFSPHGATAPSGPGPPHERSFTITFSQTHHTQ